MAQLRAFTTIHKGGTTRDFKRRVVAEVGRRAVQQTRSLGVIMSELQNTIPWGFSLVGDGDSYSWTFQLFAP